MKALHSDNAPKAVGPYSQAIVAGDLVFCSGQLGLDPKTGTLVEGGTRAQTDQALKNIREVLKEAGLGMQHVVSVNLYLRHIEDFAEVNDLYGEYFSTVPQPSRVTVEVSNLPKNALVEVSCIAHK